MKPLFPAHRAAEEFARVIDGHPDDDAADLYAPLAAVVTLLRSQDQPEPRPEFIADLRSRLMVAADAELVPAPVAASPPPTVAPPRRRERRLAAAAAALVLVGGTAGMAAATQGSTTGDPLYPLKLGVEQASLALHPSDAGKGTDLLGQAGTRLSEVQGLIAGNASASAVRTTLQSFTDSAGQGADLLFRSYQQNGDDQDISTVRTFATTQMAALARLVRSAPPGTRPAFQQAADIVADLDQQARVLCAACSEAGPLAVPQGLVGPASTGSLTTLIEHPAVMAEAQARAARALAAAAEAAGSAATRQSKSVTSEASGSTGAGTPATGDTTGQVTGAVTGPLPGPLTGATSTRTPVKDLVSGVTSKTGGLTNGLSDAASGVTGTVDSALGGTGGSGSGGSESGGSGSGGSLGDTLTGTVGGVLGGLTGN